VLNCSNLTLKVVANPTPKAGATHYLEVGFLASAGTLAAGGQTGAIQTAFHFTNWPDLIRGNDYSFDATKNTALVDWMRVTLYRNGNLVWGTEP